MNVSILLPVPVGLGHQTLWGSESRFGILMNIARFLLLTKAVPVRRSQQG